MSSKETKLIKNTAIIAVGNMATKGISFFMLPLYTALLTTAEYGTVDLLNVCVTVIVCALTLQFEQGLFRFLIEVRGNKQQQIAYMSTGIFTILGITFVFSGLAYGILSAVSYEYKGLLIANIIVTVALSLLLQIPRGLGKHVTYTVCSFISGSCNVLFNVIFIAGFHWNVKGMLLATIFAQVTAGFYAGVSLKLHRDLSFSAFDKDKLRILLNYSLPLVPNTLCWWVVNASDRVIIKLFLGVSSNGIYSVAYKFPSLFTTVTNIFSLSFTESAAENVNDLERDTYYQTVLNQSIRFYSSVNLGIIAGLPLVFSYFVKNDFMEAFPYIPILLVASFFHSVANLYGSIYTALKRTKQIAKTTILSTVINVVADLVLIKGIGLYAAAISSTLSYIVITLVRHFDIKKTVTLAIDKKYMISEGLVYALVLFAYYSNNPVRNLYVFVLLIPYTILQNKHILFGISKALVTKVKQGG